MIVFNTIVAVLYLLVFLMGKQVEDSQAEDTNLTIYTQGTTDWTTPGWSSFTWSDTDSCPDGYEVMGSEWLGTYAGVQVDDTTVEIADRTVSPSDPNYIPSQPAVLQTVLYSDMTNLLCGKRADASLVYNKVSRAQMNDDGEFICSDDAL